MNNVYKTMIPLIRTRFETAAERFEESRRAAHTRVLVIAFIVLALRGLVDHTMVKMFAKPGLTMLTMLTMLRVISNLG